MHFPKALILALALGLGLIVCSLGLPVGAQGQISSQPTGKQDLDTLGAGQSPSSPAQGSIPAVEDGRVTDFSQPGAFSRPPASSLPAANNPGAVEFDSTVKPLPADFKLKTDRFSVSTAGGDAGRFLLEPGITDDVARNILFTKYDVVVLIDKSTSMLERDCPRAQSRWDWCREQTRELAGVASQYGSPGIEVVVFADNYCTYRNCGLDMVAEIFRTNMPGGSTNTAEAIAAVLDEHFLRWHGGDRPLLVAIITDGRPSNPEKVKTVIVDATHQMSDPHQVSITFLQVGEDPDGYNFARDVDYNLVGQGARYDIVYSKTFDQLKQCGVVGALIDAITRHSPADPALGLH